MTTPNKKEPTAEALAPARPSIFGLMAAHYNMSAGSLANTLKRTIFPGGNATEEQLAAFCIVAHHYGLNPFLKEIYAFPSKSGGIMPVVGVDGWVSLVNRAPELEWFEITEDNGEDGKPVSATCTIKRRDRERPLTITEYYAECKRETESWRMMPHRMLRHKALKECARYAFGFAGLHDEDEARDATTREDAAAKAAIPVVTRRSAAPPVAPAAPEAPAEPPEAAAAAPAPSGPGGLEIDFDEVPF